MNKCFLIFLSIVFAMKTLSQPSAASHPSLLEVRFLLNDYKSNSPFNNGGKMDAGLGFQYLHGWNTHIDWTVGINSSFPDSASKIHPTDKKYMLIEGDLSLRFRMNEPDRKWQPYLQGGVGISAYHGDVGIFIPLGVGVQRKISPLLYILADVQYRIALSNKSNDHYFYGVGLAGTIAKGKKGSRQNISAPSSNRQILFASRDRDGDGIVDSEDACPDQPGLAQFHGCPDSDRDGIPDNLDRCPTVPGFAKYSGCPIPDRDGDGINDEEDQCPDVPGFARYHGCPIPDTDKDGVNDEEDSCFNVPGLIQLHGCPPISDEVIKKINLAAKNILFKTGSFELLPNSFSSLDTVVSILNKYSYLNLRIEGHTDNVGSVEANQLLSENRANAIMGYLKQKGISESRLKAMGFGKDHPIASNNTPKGRAINRRVELNLYR